MAPVVQSPIPAMWATPQVPVARRLDVMRAASAMTRRPTRTRHGVAPTTAARRQYRPVMTIAGSAGALVSPREDGFRPVELGGHPGVLGSLAGEQEGDLRYLPVHGIEPAAARVAQPFDGVLDVAGDDDGAVGVLYPAHGQRVPEIRWVADPMQARDRSCSTSWR
jgi:hypothetical protein